MLVRGQTKLAGAFYVDVVGVAGKYGSQFRAQNVFADQYFYFYAQIAYIV